MIDFHPSLLWSQCIHLGDFFIWLSDETDAFPLFTPQFSLFGSRSASRTAGSTASSSSSSSSPVTLSARGGRSRVEPPSCSASLSKAEFLERVRRSNQACQEGEFALAVRLYSEALSADPQNCILYSNRSAAYLRLGQYATALDDAIKARVINPKWPKVSKCEGTVAAEVIKCWVLWWPDGFIVWLYSSGFTCGV